jgi:hypothetical protein
MFDQLSRGELNTHVPVLGWLRIAASALFALIGLFVLVLLVGIGVATGDADAARILTVVGTAVGGFLMLLALPGAVAGIGLLQRRTWGRVLALIVAVLDIANFPIGTAISFYSFWLLLQRQADEYFR